MQKYNFQILQDPRLNLEFLKILNRDEEKLPLPMQNRNSYFTFLARNAIFGALEILGISQGDEILVPSYHCTAAIEPIIAYGAKVIFYNFNKQGMSDFEDILAKINKDTRAILVIHYFGFPQPISKFKDICEKHRLFLIEDCAHVIWGDYESKPIGAFGDVSVYSLRKFFPIYDGAQLVVNNDQFKTRLEFQSNTLVLNLKAFNNTIDDALGSSSVYRALLWILNLPYKLYIRMRAALKNNSTNRSLQRINTYEVHFDITTARMPMSKVSKYIFRHSRFQKIVHKRRSNYLHLLDEIKKISELIPLYAELPEKVCPWVFPVFSKTKNNFHILLRENGVPATTWGAVIHSDLILEQYPDAKYLYENLIFLPIHQNLGSKEIDEIIKIINYSLDLESNS